MTSNKEFFEKAMQFSSIEDLKAYAESCGKTLSDEQCREIVGGVAHMGLAALAKFDSDYIDSF